MRYDKGMTGKGISKDRPFPYNSGGGPRDQQRRLDRITRQSVPSEGTAGVVIEELKNQIMELTKLVQREPATTEKPGAEFTAEEVDEEIRKAVLTTMIETKADFEINKAAYEERYNKLTTEIIELKEKESNIKARFDSEKKEAEKVEGLTKKIEELTMAIAADRKLQVGIDPDRPQIEEVIIDPIDGSKPVDIEPHLKIKSVSHEEKIVMDEKVNKLKSLLDKLPGS